MQTDKLISRIKAVLNGDTENFEVQLLAAEYAARMMQVRNRLEQCAVLINAGNDYAALQVAESAPLLLETAAELSFAESPDWIDFCRERALPCPVPLDRRHVEMAGNLYGRQISESHPLYRDYRQAVRERDDLRALNVLASVAHINPNDRNAQEEIVRLGAKVREDCIRKMDTFLAAGDEAGAIALAQSPGLMRVPGIAESEPFKKIKTKLADRARAEAKKRAGELLTQIGALRQREDWQAAALLLGECRSLEAEHRFALDNAGEENLIAAESWVDARRSAHRQEEERKEKIRAANAALAGANAPLPAALTRAVLTARAAALHAALRSADNAGAGVDAALTEKARALSKNIDVRLRRKNFALAAGIALGLAVPVVAALVAADYFAGEKRRAEIAGTAASLMQSGGLVEAENFLRANEDLREAGTETAVTLDALKNKIAPLRQKTNAVAGALAAIKIAPADAATPENFAKQRAEIAALKDVAATLPADARAELAGEFAAAETHLDNIGKKLADQFEDAFSAKLAAAENLIAEAAGVAGTAERARAFDALKPTMAKLDAEGEQLGALLAGETRERAKTLSRKFAAAAASREQAAKAEQALDAAASLESYFEFAKPLSDAGNADIAKIFRHEDALRNPENSVLTDTAQKLWSAAAGMSKIPATFLPPETSPGEIVAAERLAKIKEMQTLRQYTLRTFAPGVPEKTETIYATAPATIERFPIGDGYELQQKVEVILADGTTEQRNYRLMKLGPNPPKGDQLDGGSAVPEGVLLARFARFYDTRGGRIVEPLLTTLDNVFAAHKRSPLLKAYLMQEILKIAEHRPGEWGILFSPALQKDAAELASITQNNLTASDWLAPENRGEDVSRLKEFFSRKRPSYFAEAQAYFRVFRLLENPGFVYVGYVSGDGKLRLTSARMLVGSLVGVSPDEQIIRRDAEKVLRAETLPATETRPADVAFTDEKIFAPYSPVLMLATSPEAAGALAELPPESAPPPAGWNNFILLSQ